MFESHTDSWHFISPLAAVDAASRSLALLRFYRAPSSAQVTAMSTAALSELDASAM